MANAGDAARRAAGLLIAYALFFSCAGVWSSSSSPAERFPRQAGPSAEYTCSARCASCHAAQAQEWKASQHAAAMQEATDASVLGRFDGTTFTKDGNESRFFKRDGKFFVTTGGPDGKPADFEVFYTFGVYPLQQYLIGLQGGRLQAFGIAWDARPASDGGQRWFSLYPHERLAAGDPLHWTGREQTWNHQCAACHSTDLKKNYDATSNSFATTWSEISVGCEACHGPGGKHVAWAEAGGSGDPLKGFAMRFDERSGVSWVMDQSGQARRSEPRATSHEIEACAACHSRREQFGQGHGPLLDRFRPSRLESGLYWPDGQQRDEVFTYGSFLQSRMHAAGVTCSDCHSPHSGQLRASGNALCGQCHAAERFDTAAHHHHAPGSKGSECANCHMPATVYMGVDARRDHSFRIPRPDLTQDLGVPNACQNCHADKSADSLAQRIRTWFPSPHEGFQHFAGIFDRAGRGAPGADPDLIRLIGDAQQPPIVRASALGVLRATPRSLSTFVRALRDPDASVRLAAVEALGRADPQSVRAQITPLLTDATRAVRMEAARVLAGPGEAALDEGSRRAFEAALKDYIAALALNADRPEQRLNLAELYLVRGQVREAEEAIDAALAIDPALAPAYVLRAEAARTAENEAAAERILRRGLEASPGSPELTHALGLSLIRQKRHSEALDALVGAAWKAPGVSRYAYVAALALRESGRRSEALSLLERALVRHPYDRDLLFLLATLKLESHDRTGAREPLDVLLRLEPESADVAALSALLERQ